MKLIDFKKRMNKNYFLMYMLVILILVLSLSLLSCGQEGDQGVEEDGGGKNILISNVINIPIEKIKTLNPIISSEEDIYYMGKLLYRSLFVLGDDLAASPDLVENYAYQEDGSLLLTLKNGVKWEDDTSLTMKDVKFTIDAILSLPYNSNSLYTDISSIIKSCKIEADGSLRIFFTGQKTALSLGEKNLETLLFPIMPAHKYNRPADLIRDVDDFLPFASGSYKVSHLEKDSYLILEANSDYTGSLPKNQIKFNYIRNKKDAINLFNTDEVNLVYLKKTDRGIQVESESTEVYSFLSNEAEVLIFNMENEYLQSAKNRKAIASAIDRDAILNTAYFQSGLVHDNLYYPGYLGVESAELKKSSLREDISLNLIYNGDNNSRKMAAVMIKENLEDHGIKVTLRELSKDDYLKALEVRDFDICISGYKFNHRYDLRPALQSGGSLNYALYSNEKMDALLDSMYGGVATGEKAEIYKSVDKTFQEDLPYFCLVYKTHGLALTKGTVGNINPSFDNIYKGIENWQINYEID